MLRQKPELNIIYISERMRHSLQPVARSSLAAFLLLVCSWAATCPAS